MSKRSRSVRRRFLVVGVAALAVLGVMMGVSFLDQSGTTSVTITPSGSSGLVFPLTGSQPTLPVGDGTDPLTSTAFSGGASLKGCGFGTTSTAITEGSNAGATSTSYDCSTNTATDDVLSGSVVPPQWSPLAGSPSTVTQSGDLAVVDATTATNYVTVNMYITNLPALAIDYSSFALPVNVYETTCTSTGCGAWSAWSGLSQTSFSSYITDTLGELTFNLPAGAGKYYDIVIEGTDHYYTTSSSTEAPSNGPTNTDITSTSPLGGSLYTITTSSSKGSLSPQFYFTATAS